MLVYPGTEYIEGAQPGNRAAPGQGADMGIFSPPCLLYSSTDVIFASWVNFDQAKSQFHRIGLNATSITIKNRDLAAQYSQATKSQT